MRRISWRRHWVAELGIGEALNRTEQYSKGKAMSRLARAKHWVALIGVGEEPSRTAKVKRRAIKRCKGKAIRGMG